MKEYTIIYGECKMIGSHRNYITKYLRLITDNLKEAVDEKIGWENVYFIFDGFCEETKD